MNGWRVAYFPTIIDGPVARFRHLEFDGEVSASRLCVRGADPTAEDRACVLDAAWRVHAALQAAYAARPFRGPEDVAACIAEALGPNWRLEQPRLGEPWPPKESP